MDQLAYSHLLGQLEELAHLNSSVALLQWDQEVFMPTKGGEPRAKTIGYLSTLAHEKMIELNTKKTLAKLSQWANKHPSTKNATVIRETWRIHQRERKLPAAFVQELSETCSRSQAVWIEARRTSNFSLFLPYLTRIIKLKRQEAEYIGYADSPYEALLDAYEPGLTSKRVSILFQELREFLTPFLTTLKQSQANIPSADLLRGTFPIPEQTEFNRFIAQKMGFDLQAGRMDISTHPFTTQFHPFDVRITTRYDEKDLLYSVWSTIHEAGHALYEQGLPAEHFGTPLGEAISLGIHESQSRIWENNIGKSKAFWQYLYPKLQTSFPRPFARVPFETFYRIINRVQPSLIRTEADEVTYNLHIILRYEIERDLIEGTIHVKDLPEIWRAKMKEYLGIRVPNDRLGVLQDVHWSMGAIGYFPTYALGNLYAAQFYHAAQRHVPKLDTDLKKGKLTPLREWLRSNIHIHGRFYSSDALVEQVTHEPLNIRYFTDYLTRKYTDL